MKVSDKGLMEIIAHEGIVQSPYRDSVGVWTIGVGHTAAAGPPDPRKLPRSPLPMEDIIALFRKDIAKYERRVNKAIKVPVSQHEFDAAVSFDYNTGGIHRASWVKKLNAGDRVGAAKSIMAWSKPRAIIPRRKKEQRLFRDGVYSSNGMANVYPANNQGRVLWRGGKRVNISNLLNTSPPPPPDVEPSQPPAKPKQSWLRRFFKWLWS